VSVGVVFVEGGQATAPEVLRDADAAIYRAKGAGKNRYELFDARMRAALVARLQTEADLRAALTADELRLLYQPVLSLERDAFVGAEALVRWQHPTRGLLAPADFIAIAEESGLIAPLGAWVLGEACRQAAAWAREAEEEARLHGPAFSAPPRTVSVNLSPRQLSHSDVPALLERALAVASVVSALGLLFGLNARAVNTLITFGSGGYYIVFWLTCAAALYARLSGRWVPAGRFSLGRFALPVNIAAVVWLTFEAINIAWPRTVLAVPGAKFYQVWAIVLIFGVLSVIGLLYVLIKRPQDRVRESAAMGDLTEAPEMATS
jgi:hypothetical protein